MMKTVKVNKVIYTIVDQRGYYYNDRSGKVSFLLRDSDGNHFTAYGKSVCHNSRLTPADPDKFADDKRKVREELAVVHAKQSADRAAGRPSFGY